MANTLLADNGVSSGSAGIKYSADGTGVWALQTTTAGGAATTAVTIDASQNVGIGTTSPGANLDVQAPSPFVRIKPTTVTSYGYLGFNNTGGDFNIGRESSTGGSLLTGSSAYASVLNSFGAYPMQFGTNGTLRMTIDSTGIVSIGVNTNYFGERLSIYQSSTTAPVAFAYAPSASFTGSAHIIQSEAASGTTWKLIDGRSAGGAIRFNVFGNGTVQNSTGTYTTISDAKLKENVVDANPQLNKLMQTRVVNYNLIDDDLKQIGWVAQELETIFPSMVFESPDKTPEGEDLGTTTKGVKLTVFIPIIVKAIQEQQALITSLTARIVALETKGETP
jgi:hypothetical protein